jgi:hypothetical protein
MSDQPTMYDRLMAVVGDMRSEISRQSRGDLMTLQALALKIYADRLEKILGGDKKST